MLENRNNYIPYTRNTRHFFRIFIIRIMYRCKNIISSLLYNTEYRTIHPWAINWSFNISFRRSKAGPITGITSLQQVYSSASSCSLRHIVYFLFCFLADIGISCMLSLFCLHFSLRSIQYRIQLQKYASFIQTLGEYNVKKYFNFSAVIVNFYFIRFCIVSKNFIFFVIHKEQTQARPSQ